MGENLIEKSLEGISKVDILNNYALLILEHDKKKNLFQILYINLRKQICEIMAIRY